MDWAALVHHLADRSSEHIDGGAADGPFEFLDERTDAEVTEFVRELSQTAREAEQGLRPFADVVALLAAWRDFDRTAAELDQAVAPDATRLVPL